MRVVGVGMAHILLHPSCSRHNPLSTWHQSQPSDGWTTANACKYVVLCHGTWDLRRTTKYLMFAPCPWLGVGGLSVASTHPYLTSPRQIPPSTWRQFILHLGTQMSVFISMLVCVVTPEAPDRSLTIPFLLHAYDWGSWILTWCLCSYIRPVRARI